MPYEHQKIRTTGGNGGGGGELPEGLNLEETQLLVLDKLEAIEAKVGYQTVWGFGDREIPPFNRIFLEVHEPMRIKLKVSVINALVPATGHTLTVTLSEIASHDPFTGPIPITNYSLMTEDNSKISAWEAAGGFGASFREDWVIKTNNTTQAIDRVTEFLNPDFNAIIPAGVWLFDFANTGGLPDITIALTAKTE